MSTSKARNTKLAVKLASDRRYKFQKNGTVKKLGSDGKFREVGTERHGYNVLTYRGTKIVTARALVAKLYLDRGFAPKAATDLLLQSVVVRKNGKSLDDRINNLASLSPFLVPRVKAAKRLSQKQIDRMIELFFEGFSVAKIARRFRRKVSRSYVSTIIKRELGIETIGG